MGQSPTCPVLLPLPRFRGTPFLIPHSVLSLSALLQSPKARQGFVSRLGSTGAPLQHPRCLRPWSTWGWHGQEQTDAHLVSTISVPGGHISRLEWGWAPTVSSRMAQGLLSVPGAASHPDWPHAETAPPQPGAGPLHMVPLAGSQRRGRCSCRDYTKPYCRSPEGFPPRVGARASPARHGHILLWVPCRGCSPCRVSPCCPLHLVPSRAAPQPTALVGGLCHPTAEVLMVLCLALNYFPDCHRHVLASGAGL